MYDYVTTCTDPHLSFVYVYITDYIDYPVKDN